MCSTLFPPKISSWGGVYNSTGIDEGRKKLIILLAIKVKARTVMWGGGRRARYVTPDLSYYWEGGRARAVRGE